jgi:hypothetical protein
MSSFNKDSLLNLFLETEVAVEDPTTLTALTNIHAALDTLLQGVASVVNLRTATAATSLTQDDGTILYNAAGAGAINLPSAASVPGKTYNLKKVGAGNPTLTPSGVETIDGAANLTLTIANQVRSIQSDGTNWVIVSAYL